MFSVMQPSLDLDFLSAILGGFIGAIIGGVFSIGLHVLNQTKLKKEKQVESIFSLIKTNEEVIFTIDEKLSILNGYLSNSSVQENLGKSLNIDKEQLKSIRDFFSYTIPNYAFELDHNALFVDKESFQEVNSLSIDVVDFIEKSHATLTSKRKDSVPDDWVIQYLETNRSTLVFFRDRAYKLNSFLGDKKRYYYTRYHKRYIKD